MRFLGPIEEIQPEVKYIGPLISEQPRVIQPFTTLSPQEGLFEGQAEITPYGVRVKPYFLSEDDLPEQNQKIERSKVLSTTLNIPFSAVYDQEEELSKEFQKHDSSWMKTATNSFKRGIGNTYVTFGRALQLTGMKDFGEDFVAYGKGLQHIYAPPIKPTEFTFDKVLTPEFWANDVPESIPFTLSLIPAALIAAYAGAGTATAIGLGAFGKIVLGSIGAGIVSRTLESAMEAAGTYDEALTAGESDEDARTRADYTFKHNLVPLTGVDIAQFLIAFTPLGKMGGGNILAKRVAATVLKLGAVGAMEAGEEVWQERVQQIARGEKPHVSPEMKEAGVIGAIFGLGLGGAGSVWTATTGRVVNTASPKLLEVYEETKNAQISMGATPEEAHLAGLDAIAETPEGKTHIEKVMTEIKDMAEGKTVEEEVIKKETKEAEQFIEKSEEIDVLTDDDIKAIGEGKEAIDVISERFGEEEITVADRQWAEDIVDKLIADKKAMSFEREKLIKHLLTRPEEKVLPEPLPVSEEVTKKRYPGLAYNKEREIGGIDDSLEVAIKNKSAEVKGKKVIKGGGTDREITEIIYDDRGKTKYAYIRRTGFQDALYEDSVVSVKQIPPERIDEVFGEAKKAVGEIYEEEVSTAKESLREVYNSIDPIKAEDSDFFDYWVKRAMEGEDAIDLEGVIRQYESYTGKKYSKEALPVSEEEVEKGKQPFISEETYQKAKKSLKEKLSPGTLRAGIDPTAISDLAVMGAYHIERVGRGVIKYAEWAKTMIKELGEEIRPYLRKIWKDANAYIEEKVPTKKVKGLVRETTGQVSLSNLIREDVVLSAAMKKAEQNARIAYRAGKKDAIEKAKAEFRDVLLKARIKAEVFAFKEGFRVGSRLTATHLIQGFKDDQVTAKETRNMLVNYIEENLPVDLRGRFLHPLIENMTKKKQESIWKAVDKAREKFTRKELIEKIEELKELKGNIAVDYQKQITEVLKDFDARKMTTATYLKLENLKKYIETNGVSSGITLQMLDKVKRLEMKGSEEMTTEELKFLADTGSYLTEMGKVKYEMQYKYNEELRKQALSKLLLDTHNLDPKLTGEDTPTDKIKNATMYMYLETLQPPRVADMIDGYGAYKKENAKLIKRTIAKETLAVMDGRALKGAAFQEMVDAGIGDLTEQQEVKILINIRNIEKSFDQVKTLMEDHGYKEIPVLNDQENKVIEIIKKYINLNTDKVAAVKEETTNKPFVRLENYVMPIKYKGELNIDPSEAIEQSRHRLVNVPYGSIKERVLGVKRHLRTDLLGIFEQAIDEQQWYIHMQPLIQDMKYLVKSKEYTEKAGNLVSTYWKDRLDIIARRGGSASANHTPFTNLLRYFKGNLTQAILGYKFTSAIMQFGAVFDALAYSQSQWGFSGSAEILQEFTKAWVIPNYAKEFIKTSPALQQRMGGLGEVAVQELLQKIGGSKKLSDRFIRGSLYLLQKGDIGTAAGVDIGLLHILEKRGVENAKEEADFLMNMVSGSSEVTMRPNILSRGEGAKTWLTFQTFFLNRWGMIAHDLISAGLIHGNWKLKYNAMIGLGIMIAAKIAEDESRRFITETITRKDIPRRNSMIWDILFAIPSNIPFFGNMIEFGRGGDVPIIRVAETLFTGAKNIITGKEMKTKIKGGMKSIESVLTLGGVPGTAQFFDLMEGIFLGEEEKAPAKPKVVKPKLKR